MIIATRISEKVLFDFLYEIAMEAIMWWNNIFKNMDKSHKSSKERIPFTWTKELLKGLIMLKFPIYFYSKELAENYQMASFINNLIATVVKHAETKYPGTVATSSSFSISPLYII
jgi:hypothetical protein